MSIWLHNPPQTFLDDSSCKVTSLAYRHDANIIRQRHISKTGKKYNFLRPTTSDYELKTMSEKVDSIICFCDISDYKTIQVIINKYEKIITKATTFYVFSNKTNHLGSYSYMAEDKRIFAIISMNLFDAVIDALRMRYEHKIIRPATQNQPESMSNDIVLFEKLKKMITTQPLSAEEIKLRYVSNLINLTNKYISKSIMISYTINIEGIPTELIKIIILYYEEAGYTVTIGTDNMLTLE